MNPQTIPAQVGDVTISIQKGGLFDRFRLNPDLQAIQAEFGIEDMGFFEGVTKAPFEHGPMGAMPFPIFYYDMGLFQAVFSADLEGLERLLPCEALRPLVPWPGRGLLAVTAFQYRVSDVDAYNEVALSIVLERPGGWPLGPLSLVGNLVRRQNWAYVWKLPVTTELACTGGRLGYNYPKYLARIDYTHGTGEDRCELHDEGGLVLAMRGRHLETRVGKPIVNHGLAIKDGRVMDVAAELNPLRMASSTSSADFTLELGQGEVADILGGLNLGRMLRYDHVPRAQTRLCAGTDC